MSKARVKAGAVKPTGPDAKKDLAALQDAMNNGTIAKRNPGEEVQAANEQGARVVITSEAKKQPPLIVKGALKEKPAGRLEQIEHPKLVPKLDAVGKAAKRMTNAIKAKAEAVEAVGDAEAFLIKALKKSKRTSITCDGFSLFLDHKGPVDKIKVQKPK